MQAALGVPERPAPVGLQFVEPLAGPGAEVELDHAVQRLHGQAEPLGQGGRRLLRPL